MGFDATQNLRVLPMEGNCCGGLAVFKILAERKQQIQQHSELKDIELKLARSRCIYIDIVSIRVPYSFPLFPCNNLLILRQKGPCCASKIQPQVLETGVHRSCR